LKMWRLPTVNKLGQWLILSLWCSGAVAVVAGFTGVFYPWLSSLLILPAILIIAAAFHVFKIFPKFTKLEKSLGLLIGLWWFLHGLQVFTPETGFDALWYHLPLAKVVTNGHHFLGDPNFYQSFNPQFSDSIFYLGFAAAGELGAKLVAYLFGLGLILSSYLLSRNFLSRIHALLAMLLISSFQVISWQVSSFYIDVAKAFWEISALYFLLGKSRHSISKSSLVFGASLASKFFSVALLPTMTLIALMQKGKSAAINFVIVSLLLAVPFYWFSFAVSGNPFYSAFEHVGKLSQIGGTSSPLNYILLKTLQLPLLPFEVLLTREYTSPTLILLLPLMIMYWKKIRQNRQLFVLSLFTLTQLLIWWYLPPLSVRYALSGFVTATILMIYLLKKWWRERKINLKWLVIGLIVAGILFLPVRMAVVMRSSQYIFGLQSKEQYLQQFLDGNVDSVLKNWHHLE